MDVQRPFYAIFLSYLQLANCSSIPINQSAFLLAANTGLHPSYWMPALDCSLPICCLPWNSAILLAANLRLLIGSGQDLAEALIKAVLELGVGHNQDVLFVARHQTKLK